LFQLGKEMIRVDAPKGIARSLLCAVVLIVLALPAMAHEGGGIVGGFTAGFRHPLSGADHVLAMVAVGIWGAFLGAPAIWVLPVVFPMVVSVGGAMGVMGIPLPATETGIALSSVVLGLMIALARRPPLWVAGVIVGAFAIFHGHAHGMELPGAADPVAYSLGFVMSTGMLHLCGIALGELTRWKAGRSLIRVAGICIACGGIGFLGGWI
jgi:urease accessory protein